MSENGPKTPTGPAPVSPLQRWTERKAKVQAEQQAKAAPSMAGGDPAKLPQPKPESELTDADMPPLDAIDERSDLSVFFSPKVSAELRRMALRKLFHLPVYNIRDGLNDYDEDFTKFEPLGDIVTADMQHMREVKERLRQARAAESENPEQTPEAAGEQEPPTRAPDEALTQQGDPCPEIPQEAQDRDQDRPA